MFASIGRIQLLERRKQYSFRGDMNVVARLATQNILSSYATVRLWRRSNRGRIFATCGRRNGVDVDLFILEAKGKQAGNFDFYNLAYALGQVFPVPATYLKELLGTKRQGAKRHASHGFGWEHAKTLSSAWKKRGFNPTITVGILLPEWSPDIIWVGGKTKMLDTSYFSLPINAFRGFIEKGVVPPPTSKAQRVFGRCSLSLSQRMKFAHFHEQRKN